MTDLTNTDIQENESLENTEKKSDQGDTHNIREVSYVVLFIGAVFAINAMETGSYRTPWPIAIVTILAGIGLFVYSKVHKS